MKLKDLTQEKLDELVAQLSKAEAAIAKHADAVNGYKGTQEQLQQRLTEESKIVTDLTTKLEEQAKRLEAIPELEAARKKYERLSALADHAELMSSAAVRDLVLSSTLPVEELAESLPKLEAFLKPAPQSDEVKPEPVAQPEAKKEEESALPQQPPTQNGAAAFGKARTLDEIDNEIQQAIFSGDTNTVMRLSSERMAVIRK